MRSPVTAEGGAEASASLWQRAPRLAAKAAVVGPGGAVTTFGQLSEDSHRLSRVLGATGLAPGDVVAVLAPNTAALLTAFAAALESGLYLLPVNTHLTAAEVEYLLTDSGAGALIAAEALSDLAAAAARGAGLPRERRLGVGDVDGFTDLSPLLAAADADPPAERPAGHRLLYTSGTTGRPKGVLKPRSTLGADAYATKNALRLAANAHFPTGEDNVHLVTGPMYHGAPLGYAMGALQLGQTVVLMDRWDATDTLRLIERHRVTTTHMVPTMFHRLLRLPEEVRDAHDVSSLRAVAHAAAPCPVSVKRAMIDWLGPIVHEYYSSSEGGGTSVSAEDWLAHPGTVGRPVPGAEVRILDETGNAAPTGTPGLIYFKQIEPFEYLGDPQKTAAAHRGNYFTVGDIGYLDGDGYLYLCDRQAETIISGGVNIYPAEIEAVLVGHPSVADAAVIGTPDDEWGEQVRAVVELGAPPADPAGVIQELEEYCRRALPGFKRPRVIEVAASLPRDSNGKLYRRHLRDRYWEGRSRRI